MHAPVAPSHVSATALAADLAGLFRYVYRRASDEFVRTIDALDLSVTQVKLLHILDGADGCSVGALAEEVGLSLPAASRAVEGLVARRVVERREDPADRRLRRVGLTDGGRDALRRLAEARLHGLEGFVGALTPLERDGLAAALAPILARDDVAAFRPPEGSP